MSTEPARDELDAMFKPLIIWAEAYNGRHADNPVDIGDFMFMGNDGDVSMYKHQMTRRYINIGTDGPLSWSRGYGAQVADSAFSPVADVSAFVARVYER